MAVKMQYSPSSFSERTASAQIIDKRKENVLSVVNPELAAEWHPTKNGNLKPDMVTAKSHKKVWWIGKCGHEWRAEIANRTNIGSGCPYCSNRIVLKGFNDLATTNPNLATEWHPTKNNNLTPDVVTAGSGKRVWWLGKCGHEWQARINKRNNGRNCPVCFSETQTSFPEQAVYFYIKKHYPDAVNRYTVSNKEFDIYIPSISVAIEYDGCYYHTKKKDKDKKKNEWCQKNGIYLIRIREKGCPPIDGNIITRSDNSDKSLEDALIELMKHLGITDISIDIKRDKVKILNQYITKKKQNSLIVEFPDLAIEWHPTKNGNLTPDMVTKKSHKKVWWKCKQGHDWQAVVYSRIQGSNCPYCSGQKVLRGFNDLTTLNPDLASEWHPTKNGSLTPDMVTAGSHKMIWWIGSCNHEWRATVNHRNKSCGCPYCSGQKVLRGFNDLTTLNPDLVSEWHPTKNNGLTPNMVTRSSGRKVWWRCKSGHEWQATIAKRTRGDNCPYCSGKRALKGFNDLSTVNPDLASEWHPTKNADLTPNMVTKGSHKKVWWQCKLGHEWKTTIKNRSSGASCPICYKLNRLSNSNK